VGAGYKANSANTAAEECPANTYSTGATDTCSSCPDGGFSNKGSSTCGSCGPGTFKEVIGSSTTCENCPAGKYVWLERDLPHETKTHSLRSAQVHGVRSGFIERLRELRLGNLLRSRGGLLHHRACGQEGGEDGRAAHGR
jgi:hypothetical protein